MSRQYDDLQKQLPVLEELAQLLQERRILRDLWEDMGYLLTEQEDENLDAMRDDVAVAGAYLTSQILGRLHRLVSSGNHRKSNQEGQG